LLLVLASEEQQHWQVLGWSCGGERKLAYNQAMINLKDLTEILEQVLISFGGGKVIGAK